METDSLAFIPSRVDGLADVTLVTVRPDRIVFTCGDSTHDFPYRTIGRPADSLSSRIIDRIRFRPLWRIIGERDWFHAPPDRFFRFYTKPQITVYMPDDDVREYAPSIFCRVQQVWRSSHADTFDLG